MKLKSREIFPTEARDLLVEKWGKVDNGISDMRLALETAEEKYFELKEENEGLADAYLESEHAAGELQYRLGKEIKALQDKLDDCILDNCIEL